MFSNGARQVACLGAAGFIGTMLVVAATSPAFAQEYSQPVTVTAHSDQLTRVVPYGDLSLANRDARKVLMHRVGIAVREVCPNMSIDGLSLQQYDVEGCRDYAWTGARPQIRHAIDLAGSGSTLAMSITITSATVK